jgi:hypothetical protein
MRHTLPDGWPGLVGIAVIVGGVALLHSRPAVVPAGGFLGSDFSYADERGPHISMTTAGAYAGHLETESMIAGLGREAYEGRYNLTIVGLFESHEAAREAGGAVEVPTGAGVLVIGPMVIVIGLEADPEGPPDPRVAQLGQHGDVFVEGDRYGEGSIVIDLECTAESDEAAARLATAIGDYGSMLSYSYVRPPWVGEPLTDDEALARATYRRWTEEYSTSMQDDPWLAEYGRRYLAATSDGERAALQEELMTHVAESRPQRLDGDVHPGVMALVASAPREADPDAAYAWGWQLGRLMGPLQSTRGEEPPTWYEQRQAGSIGSVRAVGRQVEVGWAVFNRFALGMTGLLSYLDAQACDDVRIRLSDFDDVRGD